MNVTRMITYMRVQGRVRGGSVYAPDRPIRKNLLRARTLTDSLHRLVHDEKKYSGLTKGERAKEWAAVLALSLTFLSFPCRSFLRNASKNSFSVPVCHCGCYLLRSWTVRAFATADSCGGSTSACALGAWFDPRRTENRLWLVQQARPVAGVLAVYTRE